MQCRAIAGNSRVPSALKASTKDTSTLRPSEFSASIKIAIFSSVLLAFSGCKFFVCHAFPISKTG